MPVKTAALLTFLPFAQVHTLPMQQGKEKGQRIKVSFFHNDPSTDHI
jgi:hypothetical protein